MMNNLIQNIVDRGTALMDVIPAYAILVKFYNSKERFVDSINTAISVLNKLGESINQHQTQSSATLEVLKAKNLVGNSYQNILNLNAMDDKVLLTVMEFLSYILYGAFVTSPLLLFVTCSKMVQLTCTHGISKYSSLGFVTFGVILLGHKDKAAYDYGQLSLQLLEHVKFKEIVPYVNTAFYCHIIPSYSSIHGAFDIFSEMICVSLENGSHRYSFICADNFCSCAFFSGKVLPKLDDDIRELLSLLPNKTDTLLCVHQAIHNLSDENMNNPILSGAYFDYRLFLTKGKKPLEVVIISVIAATVAYLFHDFDKALEIIEGIKPIQKYVAPTPYYRQIMYLYEGLVSLSIARHVSKKEEWKAKAKHSILKFKDLSDNTPENFSNKYHLLEAELSAVDKNESQAIMHYRQAIYLSSRHSFVHEEALACERAGMFYLELGAEESAIPLLLQSYRRYEIWGATSKKNHLLKCYPLISDKLDHHSVEIGKFNEGQEIDHSSHDDVSVLTENSFFLNTWDRQKRIAYSARKKNNAD